MPHANMERNVNKGIFTASNVATILRSTRRYAVNLIDKGTLRCLPIPDSSHIRISGLAMYEYMEKAKIPMPDFIKQAAINFLKTSYEDGRLRLQEIPIESAAKLFDQYMDVQRAAWTHPLEN